jgi:hypothetical protein
MVLEWSWVDEAAVLPLQPWLMQQMLAMAHVSWLCVGIERCLQGEAWLIKRQGCTCSRCGACEADAGYGARQSQVLSLLGLTRQMV